jgi:hypothetical protein
MSDRLQNQVRIEQTRRELEIIKRDIAKDLEKRQKSDAQGRYASQLMGLQKVLTESITTLQIEIAGLDDHSPSDTIYAICREYDECVLLLRRVLAYYRNKYDQRDDGRFKDVLLAADDVVWSCYAGVFQNATGAAKPPKPVPLPYIEPEYSPVAVPRDQPTPDVRPDRANPLLWRYLKELPIPIVGLPPVCVEQPWWLIYLGHELGHHLQYDLMPEQGLVKHFKQFLRTTIQAAPGADVDNDAQRWARWGEEIFADICSVYCMGHWAARAIVELIRDKDRAMLCYADNRYPCPVVRLHLLAEVAQRLGLDRQTALGAVDPQTIIESAQVAPNDPDVARARRDLSLVRLVVDKSLKKRFDGIGTFADLYDWRPKDFAWGGSVVKWTEALRGRYPASTKPDRRAAREIISGAMGAWVEVATIDDTSKRRVASRQLSKRLLIALQDNREDVPRAGQEIAPPDVAGLGEKLGRMLLQQIHERSAAD